MVYQFLFITLKNILSLVFFILKAFCCTLNSRIGGLENWRIRFLMSRTGHMNYSSVHYCSSLGNNKKRRKIQWHVHQYYFGPKVAPGEFIGPNIQQADNLSCLFLLALHNTSGACTYFLKDCSQSTFGFLLWRLRPKDPSRWPYYLFIKASILYAGD